ncbi:hypothetical protein CA13_65500 [Planctomycetes bacterium CA13]|uniref:Uncharacterized protein n=1 Tax=Novipirellula herctigrandis TaxID=2527986 RepID=A0A5C5ZD32_9BACT|nr:hypothetical protein CA13_65500 [Planctomycetes bacterium CA13]
MTLLRIVTFGILVALPAVFCGCNRNTSDNKDGLVLHYIDLSNKSTPASWVLDDKPQSIMNDAASAMENAATLPEKANFLVVYDKASLLKHFADTANDQFTVQHVIADAELDKETQLYVDSKFVHARDKIGTRLDNELLILDDYIAASKEESLRELFVRLKDATFTVRQMIESSSPTKTYD